MLSRRRLLAGLLGLGLSRAQGLRAEEVVGALEVPWALAFLPGGGMLISERPGRIRLFRGGRLSTYAELPVYAQGESGLLGLALHPRFPEAPYVYAYRTVEEGGLRNQVVRLRHLGERGVLERVILDGIPARPHGLHSGGRIAFGPDGMLYVTTGEVYERELAQDLASLGGKVLRLTPEGEPAPGNPFLDQKGARPEIYSLGHRNPQGLAWHPVTGELFLSEHGPSGEQGFGHDEVNVVVPGGNYGWPRVVGRGNDPRYRDPLYFWPEGFPPGNLAFWRGDLYVAGLRGQALLRLVLDRDKGHWRVARVETALSGFGRLREVQVGPDEALYVTTSNRDGRGQVRPNDDKVLRLR
ncbi:PQQ-dependent sugar dehydrogenase [Thermus antranikianii]|uniref:PQQ-dependent sugar dehydrogenase n=1 Tax=Thermus antranikianii TaxID=88190 RepID=UPI001C799BCD|nr:PQQ-dependent sugar dehydrogenase [Thermus antranikianii]QWK21166.1 MAG: PQQ-dependent sugar dehydrogenase [Thermus antranikianii]